MSQSSRSTITVTSSGWPYHPLDRRSLLQRRSIQPVTRSCDSDARRAWLAGHYRPELERGLHASKINPDWTSQKHLNLHLYYVNQYNAYANQPALGRSRCCRIPLSMTAGNVPCSTCLSSTNSFATPGIPIRSKRSPIQRSHLRSGLPLVSPPAPTRNRCRSGLNSLSSLNSHISTGKQGVNVPLREQPTRNRCRSGLNSLSSLNSHISTGNKE